MKVATDRPAIMIGPGTGVAPLRSMIHERAATAGNTPRSQSESHVLFFGGRNRAADFFFEQEWTDMKGTWPLEVFPAFSRDQVTTSSSTTKERFSLTAS